MHPPILQFDPDRGAVIQPRPIFQTDQPLGPCVITFFREALKAYVREHGLEPAGWIRSETVDLPVYLAQVDGARVGLVQGYLGGPGASGQLEELIATGFDRFVVCGGAGVLRRDLAVGHLVLPEGALREEGVSYHYLPADEPVLRYDPEVLATLETVIRESGASYVRGLTWTTDAMYRETRGKIARRAAEGCLTVEMEASAYLAVARFRGVKLGQILYSGDDVSGEDWDRREWDSRGGVRSGLLALALKASMRL